MKFSIYLFDENDIRNSNASYSLGWFEVSAQETTISFFKGRLSMIFLNLSSLIRYLSHPPDSIPFRWVGEDNGYVYFLTKKNKHLEVRANDITLNFVFDTFKKAVLEGAKIFTEEACSINPSISQESGYLDLQMALAEVK